jgi:hypothetical protein
MKEVERKILNHPELGPRITAPLSNIKLNAAGPVVSMPGGSLIHGNSNTNIVNQMVQDIKKGQQASVALPAIKDGTILKGGYRQNPRKAHRKAMARQAAKNRGINLSPPVERTTSPVTNLSPEQRVARKGELAERRTRRRREAGRKMVNPILDSVPTYDGVLSRVGATAGTLTNSMFKSLSEKGALGKAFKGSVQASAFGAATQGTLSYLQGDDPWEGAKTGAIRGAMIGAGYQGLKAATHARSAGKGITGMKSNMKQIGRGLKSTYSAHTVEGQAAIRQNGQMSNQLKRILMANKDKQIAEQVLF